MCKTPEEERISALVDGWLAGQELEATLEAVVEGADQRADWHLYHVVGDVLRSSELGHCSHDAEFVTRLRRRLQDESVPALQVASTVDMLQDATMVHGSPSSAAANDVQWRWSRWAGVATVLLAVGVGWGVRDITGPGTQAIVSQAPVPVATAAIAAGPAGEAPVMIRDPQLDALLAAHKQFGGTSALQMPAGFLRNATFESPAR